jgi:hypothetical protein
MKVVIAIASLAAVASVPAQGIAQRRPTMPALSVNDVIRNQQVLIGRRVLIRGRLSTCERLSCAILGRKESGVERFLSIGRSPTFDAAARPYAGRTVEIEARLTDTCLPGVDPDVIAVCADRADTLVEPVFIRAR